MKKLLLFFVFFTPYFAYSQDFWTEYSTGVPIGFGVRSISIVDQNTTWLNVGRDGAGDEYRLFKKTDDGGLTWTLGQIDLGVISDNMGIANIHGISSSVAYAAVYPYSGPAQGGIWKTEDGGNTWIRQISAAFSNLNSYTDLVYFWNINEGVTLGAAVDGYFEIYVTSNGGNLWTRLPSTPAIVPLNGEVLAQDVFEVNGNSIWVGTSSGRILKSSDKGLNWNVFQSPLSAFGGYFGNDDLRNGKLAFSDQSNGLLQSSSRRLFKTIDGGLTWSEIIYAGDCRSFDITAVPGLPNTYISVGSDSSNIERGSSYSVDGGNTWFSINNNPDTNFVDGLVVEMLDADHGFAGGYTFSSTGDGIFKWGGGALLRQAQLAVSTFSDEKAVTVYPNPTSGVLNITAKKIKQIEVTDLLGKQITYTQYSSLNSLELNLDYLTAGIYMLRVTNDEGVFVGKVIKE